MSIVIITIPGESKRAVVDRIQKESGDAVSLIIVQTPRRRSFTQRVSAIWNRYSWWEDIYYGLRLRLDAGLRKQLEVFRARSNPTVPTWSAPVIETDTINDPAIIERVRACQPTVLAVWGSTIITDELSSTAPHAINLHLGCAPHYRGAIANQRAVERHDFAHIGYTVHYINSRADAGDIIAQQCGATDTDPETTFTTLNDAAETAFVTATTTLAAGHTIPRQQQDSSQGENVRLREWTPAMRYRVANIIKQWHDIGTPPSNAR